MVVNLLILRILILIHLNLLFYLMEEIINCGNCDQM